MFYISPMIDKYISRDTVRFHVPGHKGKLGYERDLTEADDLDDLQCPKGAILQANRRIARLYNMDYATMVTCGSTGCIHAMLLCAKGTVLMGRDAHKSAVNAAYLFNIPCEFVDDVSTQGYLKAIESSNAQTLYITYPNYYGEGIDTENVIRAAKNKNMFVIADCAHGAHFICSKGLPTLPNADMLCVSVHKTMGALTGGAAVMCRKEYEERLYDNLFRIHSTSPSYLILESIDNAYAFVEDNSQLMDEWIERCIEVRDTIKSKVDLKDSIDPTRFTISAKGYTGYELYDMYKAQGVIAEMADLNNVVFLTSPHDIDSIERIKDIRIENRKALNRDFSTVYGDKYKDICWVKNKPVKTLHYKEAQGMVAYKPIGAYPPGTAVVMPGEIITGEVITYMERIMAYGGKLFSVNDEMIQVVDI